MISTVQAVLLALIQGVTELFPISSLGHSVILPKLFGWNIDQHGETFLPFLVVLHLGTAVALLLYFWRDWLALLGGVVGVVPPPERAEYRRVLLLLIVGTVPAGIVGVVLEKPLRGLFGSPYVAAAFLIVNGLILLLGERYRRRAIVAPRAIDRLTWGQALWIGIWQTAALIPGISRSGVTMTAGLVAGLRHEAAARFSFLLATPIIAGASLVEIPKLRHAQSGQSIGLVFAAGIVAGVAAYASVWFLMRYFRRHEIEALDPFGYYCIAAGILALGLLTFVV